MPEKILSLRDKIKWWHKIAFLAVLLFVPFAAKTANAATLYLSPSDKTCKVDQTCALTVYVTSNDQAMNAASGVISFPKDKLEISLLSKSGSIFGLWVQEPSFSNSAGTVNFEGIVMNPGFTGTGGKLLTINFKAKAPGAADVVFASGEVLANDGQGTNILKSLGSARINVEVPVTSPAAAQATTPTEAVGVPFALQVISPTHPDSNKWYNSSNPKFSWQIPKGTTALRVLYDDKPSSRPTVVYSPPIGEKELKDVPDGIWYFHLQLKNQNGWGTIAHFRFQIDTHPPEPFKVQVIDGEETNNPRPTILFDTTDSVSGIDYYQVKIGEGDFNTLAYNEVKKNPYTLPPQPPGKRTILVKAVDKAGNYTTDVGEVIIKSINSPSVAYYSKELTKDQTLIVRGSTYPKAEVFVWLLGQKDNAQPVRHVVQSDENGSFTFVNPDRLDDGAYSFWLVAKDANGAQSEPTEKYSFIVQSPGLLRFSAKVMPYLTASLPLAAVVILLVFLVWYAWHKFKLFKKKLRRETGEVEQAIHQVFRLIKNDLSEFLKIFEKDKHKRNLTEEENEIVKRLKKNLEQMEEFVEKEVKEIEKEVK